MHKSAKRAADELGSAKAQRKCIDIHNVPLDKIERVTTEVIRRKCLI